MAHFSVSFLTELYAAGVINEKRGAMHHLRAKMEVQVCNVSQRHCAEPRINDDNGLKPGAQRGDHNTLFAP